MLSNFEYVLKETILKELDKESFLNSHHNDICFLTQDEINDAVEKGIKKVFEKIKIEK